MSTKGGVVTRQALALRIRRRLETERKDLRLRKSRGHFERMVYGEYYLFNTKTWRVRKSCVEIEALGRELGLPRSLDATRRRSV